MTATSKTKRPRVVKPPPQREGAPPRTAYTLPEVAESLGISTRQVQRLAQNGELPTKRIGGRVLVLVDAFRQFVAEAS